MAADITIDPVTVEALDNTLIDLGITIRLVNEPVVDLTSGTGGGPGGSVRPTSGLVYPRLVG
jgi:hypothetical protein